jgi:two-component system LytT family sensor kinase
MPFMILINYLLFGKRYLLDGRVFLAATAVTALILTFSWQAHIWVAETLRNRFPRDRDMIRRLTLVIFLFVLMTWVTLTLIFWGYDYFHFLGYEIDESVYNAALGGSVILNVFVSVVNESVSSFEKWKTTLTETEQLKKEHMHSQLLGLKNQVSPHFLFNSLNSLSSLITEDPPEAERFLDEMSKVYRYLLRNNEEQVVELGTELQFTHSYFHLLKARYGKGVELVIDVDEIYHSKLLPPLTLQILLDNVLKLNLISKDRPLSIHIYMNESGWLEIRNNVQRRIADSVIRDEEGIANISNKYRLLCNNSIQIVDQGKYRITRVPLLSQEQIVQHESI